MVDRRTAISTNIDEYRDFYGDEWGVELLTETQKSALAEPCFDLIRQWEAISHARALPWTMIQSLEAVLGDVLDTSAEWNQKTVTAFKDNLVCRLESRGQVVSTEFGMSIQECLQELSEKTADMFSRARAKAREHNPDVWTTLSQHDGFHSSIWGLERMTYAAVYYAYEWFVVETLRIVSKNPGLQLYRKDDIKVAFKKAFDQELCGRCWNDQQVVIARMARHALVHNGGRMTNDLAKQSHGFQIEEEEIQILPKDTNDLFVLLRDRVTELVDAAIECLDDDGQSTGESPTQQ